MNKRTEENVLRDGSAMELPVTDAASAAVASGLVAGSPPPAAPVPSPAAAKK